MCAAVNEREEVEGFVGLRWISGTHIYPSVAERDTARTVVLVNTGRERAKGEREKSHTDGIDSN